MTPREPHELATPGINRRFFVQRQVLAFGRYRALFRIPGILMKQPYFKRTTLAGSAKMGTPPEVMPLKFAYFGRHQPDLESGR